MLITLTQQISQLERTGSIDRDPLCDQIIGRGIIKLIQRQPVYGILLAKLNRIPNSGLASPLGLGWFQQRITLAYNGSIFVQRIHTAQELIFWLEHEALHLIWLHPARYSSMDWITHLATDVAVNQYVSELIPRAVTLEDVNRTLGLHLPAHVNSKVYVDRLRKAMAQRDGHSPYKRQVNRDVKRALKDRSDDHHFWNRDAQMGRQAKAVQIKHLVMKSYRSAGTKARGTLPGHVLGQLRRLRTPNVINWRRYVRIGLGSVPFGQKPSRARFNRRQAYRMDLMGSVSNYVQPVRIFVDNSGSMSNLEISVLLSQLVNFLKQFPVRVGVYAFDTEVHADRDYYANNYHQVRFVRVGGGGTRFQCIFNYCHRHFSDRQQLIIILTDGYGESWVNYHRFDNLLWLLTAPKSRFSVKNVRGSVASLTNDVRFRNYRFGKEG